MRHASLLMGAGIAMGSIAVGLAYACRRVAADSERITLTGPASFDAVEPYDGPFDIGFASEADTELDAERFDADLTETPSMRRGG